MRVGYSGGKAYQGIYPILRNMLARKRYCGTRIFEAQRCGNTFKNVPTVYVVLLARRE